MGNYTLWSLNAISDLIEFRWADIQSIFQTHSLAKGNIISFLSGVGGSLPENYPQHRLMFEEHVNTKSYSKDEEYFVPIPLKCIGLQNPLNIIPDSTNKNLLNSITSGYSFFQDSIGSKYWNASQPISPIQSMRMHSLKGIGYYQFLREYSKAHNNTKHILIGYSQGGLVARYLAFLDKHVFREDLISGIITIGSPNFGSPLANIRNRQTASSAVVKIIQTAFSLYTPDNGGPFLNLYSELKRGINIESVVSVIEKIMLDLKHDPTQYADLKSICIGMRKWFSGINPDPDFRTAFQDLSIENYQVEHSVLSLVEKYNLQNASTGNQTFYGSIINIDNSTANFLNDIGLGFINLFGGGQLFSKTINSNLLEIQNIFKQNLIVESDLTGSLGGSHPVKSWLEKYYSGSINPQIPAFSHDYVIPSNYQVLLDKGDGGYLGCELSQTNHASGCTERVWLQLQRLMMRLSAALE